MWRCFGTGKVHPPAARASLASAVEKELIATKADLEKRRASDGRLFTKDAFAKEFGASGNWDDLTPFDGGQETWNFKDFLGAQLGRISANALAPDDPVALHSFKKDPLLHLALARTIGKVGSVELVKAMLEEANVIQLLAESVYDSMVKVATAKAATGAELNDKYIDGGAYEMSFGNRSDFFGGLERRIGAPKVKTTAAMIQEHCSSCDSQKEWTTGNYAISTTSKKEFLLVAQEFVQAVNEWKGAPLPDEWVANCSELSATLPELQQELDWPEEKKSAAHPRKDNKASGFLNRLMEINEKLDKTKEPKLLFEEGIALRLYTGPLFEKFNAVSRGGSLQGDSVPIMKKRFLELCAGDGDQLNRYTTTIYVVTSALIKASKLTEATTVYRGMQGGTLPKEFWTKDDSGVKGGVEFAFMSTTMNRDVAFQYAQGNASMVLKMETGMIDKGADLQWISQYPYEKEICFPPLTSMQVMGTEIEDGVLVVNLRLNLNLTIGTIEDVIFKRRKVAAELGQGLGQDIQKIADGVDPDDAETMKAVANIAKARLVAIMSGKPEVFNNDAGFLEEVTKAFEVKDGVNYFLKFLNSCASPGRVRTEHYGDLQKLKFKVDAIYPDGVGLEGKAREAWSVLCDRINVMRPIAQNGYALAEASEDLQADREIVLAAVTKSCYSLQYASEDLKADREIVLAAVTQGGNVLQQASDDLRADREIVLAAVTDDGSDGWYEPALKYASDDMKRDREVVLTAVTQNPEAWRYVHEDLKQDPEVRKAAGKE